MSRDCKCADPVGHAKAVEGAVFQCLLNAQSDPARYGYWLVKADLLEGKFTTEHGRHYSYFLKVVGE